MTIIKNLDCTVRDGGYINNWRFNESTKAQANSSYLVEFYATGFKIRTINGASNQNDQYLFWAEAERPMVTSTGIPATAG